MTGMTWGHQISVRKERDSDPIAGQASCIPPAFGTSLDKGPIIGGIERSKSDHRHQSIEGMPLHSLAACEPTRASRRIDYPGREYSGGAVPAHSDSPVFVFAISATVCDSDAKVNFSTRGPRCAKQHVVEAFAIKVPTRPVWARYELILVRCLAAPDHNSARRRAVAGGNKSFPKSQSNKGTHDRRRHRFADRRNLAPPTYEQCDGNAFACERYCRGRSRRATPQHDHVISGLDRRHRCAAIKFGRAG